MAVIGIMGGHEATPEVEALAYALGAALAGEGFMVLTGGRNEGIMAAATAGAKSAGGLTIGVHPGARDDGTHAAADVVIFTGIGYARNHVNILSSHAIIALEGGAGTLSEVAFADTYETPTALLGFDDKNWFGDRVARVDSVSAAVAWAKSVT